MARSSELVDDPSPLTAPYVDHDVRAGWLVRTSRLHRPYGSRLLGDLADEVGVTSGTLSRWETGRATLTADHLERLESTLPTPPGSLRGTIALQRAYFGSPAVRRTTPSTAPRVRDMEATSARVRAVFEGGARGLDWMHLADDVDEGRLLVPVHVMEPVLATLIDEHVRSVVAPYFCREDALVRLAQGPYGPLLERMLLEVGLAEDTQVRIDTLGLLFTRPSAALFRRLCELLGDERDDVFRGAAWSLELMLRRRVLRVPPLLPSLERALVALPETRRATGFELLASLPMGIQRALEPALGTPTPPRGLAALGARHRRAVAGDVTDQVARALGVVADPMLERLVRETLFDPFWSKRLSARLLLMATPYASLVGDCIARALRDVDDAEDDPLGVGALDFVTNVSSPEGLAVASAWAHDPRGPRRRRGLTALAHFGHDLDAALLEDAVRDGGATTERAMYAAGMTGSPVLTRWAADPDPEVARGAVWWLRHGPRVTD